MAVLWESIEVSHEVSKILYNKKYYFSLKPLTNPLESVTIIVSNVFINKFILLKEL